MRFLNMRLAERTPSSWHVLLGALCIGLLAMALTAVVAPAPARAQSSSGPTTQQKATHYSLYYEDFKNDNFASARKNLMWVLENAPGFPPGSKNDDRNYERAVELYEGLAEQAADDAQRSAHLDTAITYLTTAPSTMEERGIEYDPYVWELKKGRFLEVHGNDLASRSDALTSKTDHYRKAFEMAPDRIDPYYIKEVIDTHMKDNEQGEALAFMDKVADARGDDSEVMKIVDDNRQQIFGRNPQARIDYLKNQMEANPDDAEVMANLFEAYVNQGNVEAASQLADRLMATNPPAEVVRQVAKMRLDDGRPEAAFNTYQQAEEQGAELKLPDYFNMGTAQQRMGNLSKARTYYRKVLEMDSEYGRAYIAIGDLYAKAVSECGGSKMGRGDKAVYWLAVDLYEKAKSVDESVASTANSKISTYRQYFPNQEDIFYRDDWDVGNSFRIDYGCYSWVNETTTVRQPS